MHVFDAWTKPGPQGKRIPTNRHGTGKRWMARWTEAGGRERSKSFTLKADAEAYLARIRVERADGTWLDPQIRRRPLGEYIDRWLATKTGCAESTRAWYEAIARARVADRWSDVPVGSITKADIIEWLAQLRADLSASRVRSHFVVLSGILDFVVDDRALTISPAMKIKLPSLPAHRPKALTPAQLNDYITALGSPLPSTSAHARRKKPTGSCEGAVCFALVLAFSGLRFGECARLDIEHLRGRRLIIERSIATVGGRQVEADTKTHREREVSLPDPVVDRVRAFIGTRKSGPLLPAPMGGRWHHGRWTAVHKKACLDAGLGHVTPHQLRHTAASMAIAAGADPKVVQKMLGHASATMTMDTYAEMFEDRLDQVADAMESSVPTWRRLRSV